MARNISEGTGDENRFIDSRGLRCGRKREVELLKILICIHGYHTNISRISTNARPAIATIVSISDHDLIVSMMLRLKYSLNIQKPLSFTCENMRLPAPMESTIRE